MAQHHVRDAPNDSQSCYTFCSTHHLSLVRFTAEHSPADSYLQCRARQTLMDTYHTVCVLLWLGG